MNLLDIDNTQGLWIILLILAVFGFIIRIAKGSQEKSELKEIINKLAEEFPNLQSFLNKQCSFELVAKWLKETKNIPEIITIRYLTILTEETLTTGILPDIQSLNKEKFNKRIALLNDVGTTFQASMPDEAKAISELNEKRNILYTSKQVVAETKNSKGEIISQNGILVLGLHYLMFFPSVELENFVDFEKLEELLKEVTEEIPLLNFGISAASILKKIGEDVQEEKSIFTDKLKEKFEKLLHENKAFLLKYFDIEKVYYAGAAKRIMGVAKFSITLKNSFTYSFWKLKGNLDLIDTVFERTCSLALMNGNMIVPKDFKDEHNFLSYYRTP